MSDFEYFSGIVGGWILVCAFVAWLNANERRKK